jgi:phospholipase/lecithinase/hemolysin
LSRYYNGRFANGAVAVDYLWQAIGNGTPIKSAADFLYGGNFNSNRTQAISFAYGGSETGFRNSVLGQFDVNGVLGQVGEFRVLKIDNRPLNNSLALVWSGGNDYFNQFAKNIQLSPDQVIANLEIAIKNLHEAGLNNFLLPNLPNLGNVPIAHIMASLYGAPQIPAILTANTLEHNQKLQRMLRKLKKAEGINIQIADIYSLTENLITPDRIVPGPASGCLYNPVITVELCAAVDFSAGSGLVFWDETHPTTEVHALFAEKMLEALRHY